MSDLVDPISRVYSTIRSALLNNQAFLDIVAVGNFLDMTSDKFDTWKTQTQGGDLPQVVLIQQNFHLNPFGSNSKIADITQTYQLIMTEGSLKIIPLNKLKMAALAALAAVGPDLGLAGLVRGWTNGTGRDVPFLPNNTDQTSVLSFFAQGISRWVSVVPITIDMYISRRDLAGQFVRSVPSF